jgi:ribosome-binding factor A
MKKKKPSRQDFLASCNEIGPEDGIDPRYDSPSRSGHRPRRKALQLCSEVARTLSHALAWEMGDDLLHRLQVESVVPVPNLSRLVVTVSLPAVPDAVREAIEQRLTRATGRLRAEVAAAVVRRRVPEIAFRIVLREEQT